MSIYIVTHKGFSNYTKDYLYKPLLVGAYINVGPNSYLKDNSDTDNISEKNQTFCELTGQYWIWKHSMMILWDYATTDDTLLKIVKFCQKP